MLHNTSGHAPVETLKETIRHYQQNIAGYLPLLEQEMKSLIANDSTSQQNIENLLDTFLSLGGIGLASDLFFELVNFYATINSEAAGFYRKEFLSLYD